MGKETILYKDPIHGISFYTREGLKKQTIYAYFTLNKKKIRFSTKETDLTRAIKVATAKYHKADEGQNIKNVTFKRVLKEFLDHKKHRVKDTTYKDMVRNGNKLAEYFGNRDITSINQKDVKLIENFRRDYYKKHPDKRQQIYKKSGKKYKGRKCETEVSNRTINVTVKLFISIMRFAGENGYIPKDQVPSYKSLKEGRKDAFITEDDLGKIWNYFHDKKRCGGTDKSGTYQLYAYIIAFCFYTGVRYPSELNNICWKDVNFGEGYVLIRDRKSSGRRVDTAVPMVKETRSILEELKTYHVGKPDDPVFVNRYRNQKKNITKSWKGAVKACGLNEELTMYSLRHSFVTFVMENLRDVPLPMLAYITGHTSTQMIEQVYGHLRQEKTHTVFKENFENGKKKQDENGIKSPVLPWNIEIELEPEPKKEVN